MLPAFSFSSNQELASLTGFYLCATNDNQAFYFQNDYALGFLAQGAAWSATQSLAPRSFYMYANQKPPSA